MPPQSSVHTVFMPTAGFLLCDWTVVCTVGSPVFLACGTLCVSCVAYSALLRHSAFGSDEPSSSRGYLIMMDGAHCNRGCFVFVVDSQEVSISISLMGTFNFFRLVPPGKAGLCQHFLPSPPPHGTTSTEILMATSASSSFDPSCSQDFDLFNFLDFDYLSSPPLNMPPWSLGALSSFRNLCLLETCGRLLFVYSETL